MYTLAVRPKLDERLKKLSRKSPAQFKFIQKKVSQIMSNPRAFKPLSGPLAGFRRVHIDGSFVLIYSIDERTMTVILEKYDHHDRVYGK